MAHDAPETPRPPEPWWHRLRRHPVVTGVMVTCTLVGAVAGVLWLTDDWHMARRLAAGAVAGAGTGLLLTATKMMG